MARFLHYAPMNEIPTFAQLRDTNARIVSATDAQTHVSAVAEQLRALDALPSPVPAERQTVTEYVPSALSPVDYMKILAGGKERLPVLDVSGYPHLRVSVSSLIRLVVDGKIALAWSERYKQLSPFGGGIRFTDDDAAAFLTQGGGTLERASEQDIRVSDVPPTLAPKIVSWFLTHQKRESGVTAAKRELAEICDVTVPPGLSAVLAERIPSIQSMALVSDEEIQAGRTIEGRSIEPFAHFIVHPLPSLPEVRGSLRSDRA